MDRLTYELSYEGSGAYDTDNRANMPINMRYAALNKLGRLEDIADITEKIRNGAEVFYKISTGKVCSENWEGCRIMYDFMEDSIYVYEYDYMTDYPMAEYRTTWSFNVDDLK